MDKVVQGLVKLLTSFQKVKQVRAMENVPCNADDILKWEEEYNVRMPSDLKQFYMTMDGLKLEWQYQYACDETKPAGMISVPKLKDLTDDSTSMGKTFVLENIDDLALVCLVYGKTGTMRPSILIFDISTFKWRLLADSFTTYLRISILHLGLSHWQLGFSGYDPYTHLEQFWIDLKRQNAKTHSILRKRGFSLPQN